MSNPTIFLGLDLGRAHDYSALAGVELDPLPTVAAPRTHIFYPADGSRPRPLPAIQAGPQWLDGYRTTDASTMPPDRCPRCARAQLWRRTVDGWACAGCHHPHGLPFPIPAPATTTGEDERIVRVKHLQRYPLKTKYTSIVDQVAALLRSPMVGVDSRLVVDATGVGGAVCDLLDTQKVPHERVTITSGVTPTRDGKHWHVPKRDLVSAVQVLLQSGRLKVAQTLPEARTLIAELQNFQYKISDLTAHDTYGAWREGTNDDLLLAVALACWRATRVRASVTAY